MKAFFSFFCRPTTCLPAMAALCLTLFAACGSAASQEAQAQAQAQALRALPLTPAPQAVEFKEGTCPIFPEVERRLLPDSLGTEAFPCAESYRLTLSPQGACIEAPDAAGLFYGEVSLQQLQEGYGLQQALPCMVITDYPRYPWRGMHLDVSRHFFDKTVIFKQLDAMARYKLNRFHWHLTDGAGWRLEIPQYPLLTRLAAWRPQALWQDWWTQGRKYVPQGTPGAYGGYYTAQDVQEVLAYAAARHIEVIPEIEMPGHSEEVLAAYPQLGCTGRPYESSEFCIGKEETFTFLENVLSYVMELFPSEYIHIGGDEAAKDHWRDCPQCQARMQAEGLKDEEELQSYLIHRIDRFIVSKGRRLLGWDEIMEGGLSPHATVMSWRGEEGGIKAAELGHNVVMSPGSHCYLDGFQDDPTQEPLASGAYLPLEKVYSYNPACATLGVQGNVWCEYIPTSEHMEYMAWPRLIALAEVGWTRPERKDWEAFKPRVSAQVDRLLGLGYHPYPLSPRVQIKQRGVAPAPGEAPTHIEVRLESELAPVDIRYTTDGSQPQPQSPLYTEPLVVRDSLQLSVALFRGDVPLSTPQSHTVYFHQGIGKRVTYLNPYYPSYSAGGPQALVDGTLGGYSYTDGLWQGFCPRDMDVVIHLDAKLPVHEVFARFMQIPGPGVFLPSAVEVAGSEDGVFFRPLGRCTYEEEDNPPQVRYMTFRVAVEDPRPFRIIRFTARQSQRAFVFTDEVVIR